MNRLAGKTALITGAASGIGRSVARSFIGEGARVIVADIDAEGARTAVASITETSNEARATALAIDISNEDSVVAGFAELAERGWTPDVVVANAGIQLFATEAAAGDLELATWERTLRVNLTGTFLTIKHAVRAMTEGGSIIATGSPTGVVGGGRGFTAYSASKAGVHGLVRVVAADYAGRGIRVNTVVPGYVETPLVTPISGNRAKRSALVDSIPLGRAGSPSDVGGIMIYLASDESSFATGGMFTVDGGATAV
jgi:3-oxoacyl-[acyl-carrier protein] reductase